MSRAIPTSVALNGKFLSAAPTGVHRVAAELILAVDALLGSEEPGKPWRLLKPRDAKRTLPLKTIATSTAGLMTWQPWEQIDLPRLARRDLLINLCNLGPLLHPASIVMMHDAQVFSTPESYGAKFRLWYQTLQPRLGTSALRILTVSEFSKTELVRFGVAPAEKIVVIPNGCDHILREKSDATIIGRLGLKPRNFVVALANVQAHKNVKLVLEAFGDPRLRDLRLVLVGRAGPEDFSRAGLAVPPSAIFSGAVSDAELKALYEDALCLAFPSTTEGFGLPPLEAMAVGCPVIAAPCGALPEVCGQAAWYAHPHLVEAWIAAFLHLSLLGPDRSDRVNAGLKQAQLFTWSLSARKLMNTVTGI